MNRDALDRTLADWRQQGWLRPLDVALARFVAGLQADAPPALVLAAALLSRLEEQGHTALPRVLLQPAQAAALATWLGWPEGAVAPLREMLATLGQPLPGSTPAAPHAQTQALNDPQGPPDCPEGAILQHLPAAPQVTGRTPLVLAQGLLQLRRHAVHSQAIAEQAAARAAPWPADRLPQPAAVRRALEPLFPPRADGAFDWQAAACALAARAPLTVITGGPGTGKTYTAARLLALRQQLAERPLRAVLAAPTGKAAARLKESLAAALRSLPAHGVAAAPEARTLHALLGARPGTRRFAHDAAHPLPLDLLFVDEASMVHQELLAALLAALPAGAGLVLLGDRDQLASVEAGSVMGDLCAGAGAYDEDTAGWIEACTGRPLPSGERRVVTPMEGATTPAAALARQTVVLRESRRFAGPIGQLARAVNAGDAAAGLALLSTAAAEGAEGAGALLLRQPADAAQAVAWALDGRAGAPGLAAALSALNARPAADDAAAFEAWARRLLADFDQCRVLCALREGPWGVAGLNAALEQGLQQRGLLQRRGEWYEGRAVIVTRNEPALGLANGDVGLVLRAPGAGAPLRAWFGQGDGLVGVSVARLAAVETAFAMTVHKSQGSEFGHVTLVLPPEDSPVLTRELVYTGVTRARQALTVLAPEPARWTSAVARRTQRLGGLAAQLQAASR